MKSVCVVGLGYIGLPTAITFARNGYFVHGVDIKREVVKNVNLGRNFLQEPDVQKALRDVVHSGYFRADVTLDRADVFVIAVPTPNKSDRWKSCNLQYVFDALDAVLQHAESGNMIIIESTIPPRTMNDIIVPKIKRKGFKVGEDLFVAHCPERVLPGNILYEMIHNDRIVGGITLACSEKVAQLYQTIIKGNVIQTNATTAETVKLIENTFRDVNIGLVNEIVRICHDLEIDGLDVIKLANMHPRVNLLQPGPGVGGHCLATDPYFLISTSPEQSQLIHIARMVNEQMPQFVVDVVEQLSLRHRIEKLTVLGLTYKGNCSDMRNSPGVTVYNELCRKGLYDVVAYDPYIDAPYVEKDIDKAVNGSSLLLILTDHDEFKDLSFIDFSLMDHPQVFDTKRVVERYEQPIVYMHLGNVHQYTRKKLASL